MAISSDEFRAAMRHLAGHVCLITTADKDGQRNGLTATAVCSVSAEPPSILCCVNKNNASYTAIKDNGSFVINVLTKADEALSNRFASGQVRGEERFAEGSWSTAVTGAPILDSALASFDCKIAEVFDGHSHGIFMGEIQGVKVVSQDEDPLLYAHGSYGTFAPKG